MRVCVIGAGPCGMSFLLQMDRITGGNPPEIVCFEKQSTWNGLWNFTWQTGTDEFGEPCHAGMYKDLWTNAPKECLEFPDYTFEDHFGVESMGSYPARPLLREYLEGRWKNKSKTDLKRYIKFNTVVRNVIYNNDTDDFTVTSFSLRDEVTMVERFSHVIVAVGIFNVPHKPEIGGLDKFRGRVLHSHDFRDAKEFSGKRVLVIGASYSAEDIAMQCLKFGARHIVCTWRTKPMGFKWPNGIEERPLVQGFDEHSAYFKDGSSAEIDAVILCTGYIYRFPFMEDRLRLKSHRTWYADNLYKGTLFLKGGNSKLFYMGTQEQCFTYTMFDLQGLWMARYIMGTIEGEPKPHAEMEQDAKKWVERANTLDTVLSKVNFQTDFLADLCNSTGYPAEALKARDLFLAWGQHKGDDIMTYRDQSFTSLYTGKRGKPGKPWLQAFDDSTETFLKR